MVVMVARKQAVAAAVVKAGGDSSFQRCQYGHHCHYGKMLQLLLLLL